MHISEFGDCIGVESGADLKSNAQPRRWGRNGHRGRRSDAAAKKEYPPPISWLARTENHSSHMPWVMKKYYSDDGRLIIREERVKHHDYFLADRSNGRLVLNLVHLDHAPPNEEVSIVNGSEEINGGDDEINHLKRIGVGLNPCGGAAAIHDPF